GDDGRPNLQWVRYRCWAIRNSAFVAVCNQPHDDEPDYMGHDIWGGHSAILDPGGTFLAQANYENDAIIVADLDIELATRENAERRRNHPAFKFWWDMGKVVLEGDNVEAPPFVPLESCETELVIAAAQITVSQDVNQNVVRIADALKIASTDGADVVVFPERAVTGNKDFDPLELEWAFMTIQEHVCLNQVYAVVGIPFLSNGQMLNRAVVMNPDGKVLAQYDQISARPDGLFTAGENTQSMWFEINGVPATMTIGDDLYWPELTELAAYRGTQLHFHLDFWKGDSEDANLVRKHSAINHVMPGVCGVSVNAAGEDASGGSLLLRRVGGHGQPNPGNVETYLPYHTSVVKTAGKGEEIMYFTVETRSKNDWQASKNRTRKNGRSNWWHWLCQGVQAIYAGENDHP
ncbi:MAG: nitrilase-related carbon-nitrogen hydrolase, partial [Candidatus Latescibacteria bacterium]|nr:nitrilase-related carbon-nitrogen hydrolase [Candidatus Latescibacterota bacterium]